MECGIECEMHFLIERQDIKGNWHLIETSENLRCEIFEKAKTPDEIHAYMNHSAVILKERSELLFSELSGLFKKPTNKAIMERVDIQELDNYDFNPLSKHYLSKIYYLYDHYGYQSFENIIHGLNSLNDLKLNHYKKSLINSVNYFSTLDVMLRTTHTRTEQSLQLLVSNHRYLELMEAKFEKCDISKLRMIVFYEY